MSGDANLLTLLLHCITGIFFKHLIFAIFALPMITQNDIHQINILLCILFSSSAYMRKFNVAQITSSRAIKGNF